MGLTLGLDTALSGLLASQQALNDVAQNITNVNTPGYTRKIINLQSRSLNGIGAGVTVSALTRNVDKGLMSQIRTQSSTMGNLNSQQGYYVQVESLFGTVGDGSSIADQLATMSNGLQQLSSDPTQAANQFAAVQDTLDVTSKINQMTASIQSLRQQADAQINQDVGQVNTDLNTLYDLNNKIVRNLSIGADVTNLRDQQDQTLTDLTKYMAVKSYTNNDGALQVYTPTGTSLLDNAPHLLTHASTSTASSWMTLAGGQFNAITVGANPQDISSTITDGEIGSMLNMRDSTLVNLQSQVDQMSQQLQTAINTVTNQGTTYPNPANTYSGTRTFANQGHVTVSTGNTPTVTYNQGSSTVAAGVYGTLGFSYSTTTGQTTITASTANGIASLTAGSVFTVSGSTNASNDGTYTVISTNGTTASVSRSNPVQTFSLGSQADVMVGIFDSSGNPVSTTTLNTIMTTDYSTGGNNPAQPQLQAQQPYGPWSMDSLTQHMQSWMQAQGSIYSAASASLDANGHMQISLGSTVNGSLVFQDHVSSTPGSAAQPATINFDATGSGTTTQTFSGFSNFLGLNDLLVTNQANSVMDSSVLPVGFATTAARTVTLADQSGQIGLPVSIPAGSSLSTIASLINAHTATTESAAQVSQTFTITSAATFSVNNPNGPVVTHTFPAGTYNLQDVAAALNSGEVVATSINDSPTTYGLRLTDITGVPLSVSITGGTLPSGASLASQLNMTPSQVVKAEVVPDGSGQRLRLLDTNGHQLYASSPVDGAGNNLISDLGLSPAATNTGSLLAVRTDIQNNPQLVSRGSVQWNATTGIYYLSAGDNTTAQKLASVMTTNQTMASAGNIAQGQYTFSSYAASTIATVATNSANVTNQQSYQQTLTNTLNTQFSSSSGVNLDQEVSSLIDYQQSYSASARVISVMQQMLQTLVDIVH